MASNDHGKGSAMTKGLLRLWTHGTLFGLAASLLGSSMSTQCAEEDAAQHTDFDTDMDNTTTDKVDFQTMFALAFDTTTIDPTHSALVGTTVLDSRWLGSDKSEVDKVELHKFSAARAHMPSFSLEDLNHDAIRDWSSSAKFLAALGVNVSATGYAKTQSYVFFNLDYLAPNFSLPSAASFKAATRPVLMLLHPDRVSEWAEPQRALALGFIQHYTRHRSNILKDIESGKFKSPVVQSRPIPRWWELSADILLYLRKRKPQAQIWTQFLNLQNIDLRSLDIQKPDETKTLHGHIADRKPFARIFDLSKLQILYAPAANESDNINFWLKQFRTIAASQGSPQLSIAAILLLEELPGCTSCQYQELFYHPFWRNKDWLPFVKKVELWKGRMRILLPPPLKPMLQGKVAFVR
jgi:hypothetical protein